MSCCSQRRNASPAAPQRRAAVPPLPAPPSSTTHDSTQRLRYLRDAHLLLRGPFSLRLYEFDASARVLTVDALDVDLLLRTGLFERDVG